MPDNPFAYPGNIDDVANWSKNLLAVPDGTPEGEYNGNRTHRWLETVQINDVTFESPLERPLRNAEPGDDVGCLTVKATVSPVGFEQKNVGRRIQARYFFNATALAERPDSGHAKMTAVSFGTLLTLVRALGLPKEAAAAGPAVFVRDYRDQCLSQMAVVTVERQQPLGQDGQPDPEARVNQNFNSWVRYE